MIDEASIATVMVPLLERGAEALRAKYAHLPIAERPIGLSVEVVTEADYVANAAVILNHVCNTKHSVHILCESGNQLCLLIERYAKVG